MAAIKIGFTGADSVGKTTLIHQLLRNLQRTKSVAVLSIGDIARQSPYPVVDAQSIASSKWILSRVIEAEAAAESHCDVLICDRTVLDIWVFSKLATKSGRITEAELISLEFQIGKWLSTYYRVFCALIDPTVPVNLVNLPNERQEIRTEFEQAMLIGIAHFKKDVSAVMLPHACSDRIQLIEWEINHEFYAESGNR